MNDYLKYRGKCKELSEKACIADSTLTLVRGFYYCPIWNRREPHWWTIRQDESIFDPTKDQFPSKGLGDYIPFDGTVICSECGKMMNEKEAHFESNYAFCSGSCYCKFVGVG